jgi:hypothetical protein
MGGELPPLVAPVAPPARRTALALPAYRHVPGLTPHPVKHPAGHLYGVAAPVGPAGCTDLPRSWRDCTAYLYGVDLFNHAYLWEAHESWEAAWNAAGHESLPGLFLQGLVQVAAAMLQHHRGVARGAAGNLAKAERRLAEVLRTAPPGPYMGFDLLTWRTEVRAFLAGAGYPFVRLEP